MIVCSGCVIVFCASLACHSSRPSIESWEVAWNEVQAAVPESVVVAAEGSREACNRLLVATREFRGRLLPSPEAALDGSIRQWLELAGGIGFSCPAAQHRLDTHRESLRELAILTAEVDAGLAMAKGVAQGPPVAR
jgi:hypothetical protein